MSLDTATSGPVLFARYGFPPNQLGYCGPTDAAGFFSRGVAGDDDGLRAMARDFDGAWAYLQLIADSNDIADPLDPRVVAAYWLGGPELDRVRPDSLHPTGARPHHSFVVFCVYPWVGMLGDARRRPQALHVLDRCRIRWGQVVGVEADTIWAESAPLVWDDGRLALGPPSPESVRRSINGVGLGSPPAEGDLVALHWDWVCDTITPEQRDALIHFSARSLALTNTALAAQIEEPTHA